MELFLTPLFVIKQDQKWYELIEENGGESGIRTHGTVSSTHAFQALSAVTISHS
jgi:hypothetical protein